MTTRKLLWRLPALLLLLLMAVAAWAQDPPKVKVTWEGAATAGVASGTVELTFADGLHGYQNPPDPDWTIPIRIQPKTPGVEITRIAYPRGEKKVTGGLTEATAVLSGTQRIPIQVRVPAGTAIESVQFLLRYQQCDESSCFLPERVTFGVSGNIGEAENDNPGEPVTGVAADAVQPLEGSAAAPKTDPTAPTEDEATTPPAPAAEGGLAGAISGAFQSGNWALVIGLLLLIGLSINLTPCVYPMVPITLTFFGNQAGGNRGARIGLGLMYVLGMALSYGLVGGIAAGVGSAFGTLFTQPWFLVALGLLMIALALSMFDVYQIQLPGFIQNQLGARSGPVGALIMGFLIGFAAAPCAGPLIIAVFTEVAKLQNVVAGVLLFMTVGLGLGIPYLFLAALATNTKALPKSGGWLKTVKSILGLVVIGVGLQYLLQAAGKALPEVTQQWIWVAYFALSATYLFAFENAGLTRFIMGLKGAAVLLLGALAGMGYQSILETQKLEQLQKLSGGDAVATQVNWKPYSLETWNEAVASGKPILVDGTADWCAECRVIERNVFEKPEAIVAMRNVVALKVDWSTGTDNAYIKATQEKFDIKGLPHLVFFRPGGTRSEIKNHLETPAELIEALKKAGASE